MYIQPTQKVVEVSAEKVCESAFEEDVDSKHPNQSARSAPCPFRQCSIEYIPPTVQFEYVVTFQGVAR
jgi:hypothetical protein